jgi:heme a synthase
VATLLTTKLIFATATTGAFVAGLDAGLLYNTFPKMGLNWVPPSSEMFLPRLSCWRSFFESPTMVQFVHRCMGTATFAAVTCLWTWMVMKTMFKERSLRPLRAAVHGMMALALLQVSLGIATLLYSVPIPLASAHQAGSLGLLSTAVYLLALFKRLLLRK